MMIPDDFLQCNPCSTHVPARFDDRAVRLRHLLAQDAPLDAGGGRHLLFVCPLCTRPWYKAGRSEYPRLSPEQLIFLSTALHVDLDALYLLPRAFCSICSSVCLGGMFSIEECAWYANRMGYRFLWESASPRRIQLVTLLCRSDGHTLDWLIQQPFDILTSSTREALAVLKWLETRPFPASLHVLSSEQCQRLAGRLPAISAPSGATLAWQGYYWQAVCPPLGGATRVVLAVALPLASPAPFVSLHASWTVLARAMRAVL